MTTDADSAQIRADYREFYKKYPRIGMYDNAVDLTVKEALAILEHAEIRVTRFVEPPNKWNLPDSVYEELLHDGAWRHLCRTDECDDVCTWSPRPWAKSDPENSENVRTRWQHKVKRSYGVRLGPQRFAVIDSMTDG